MLTKRNILSTLFLLAVGIATETLGMNKVVLKAENANGGKNMLRQEMFNTINNGVSVPNANTIFVIQSDFELAEDITIPTGSILEFDGGSFKNGRLNTNGCYIDAPLYQIFDNVQFNTLETENGSLQTMDNIYIKVLKAKSFVNKKANTIVPVNSTINRRYTYQITGASTSSIKEGNKVKVTLNGKKYKVAEETSDNRYRLKYDYTQVIGIVNSQGEMASGEVDNLDGITFYAISPLSYSKNSTVTNKEIHPEWFGAKGDNKNDDSYAFNTALDLAYYSDSKVTIGNGVYKINDGLVIHTHTNLVGVVPTVELPVRGCFSVNTDVAMLVFDKRNPSGSYQLDNIGFIPFSDKYKSNYTGIKIYHSQNHARISNIGLYYPKKGIEIDAIGGVQLLRCEDISQWGEEKKDIEAFTSKYRLGGWFNANYFRPAFIANSTVMRCEGGGDNTLDGGSTETNSLSDYLIELDKEATLLVRGGLYKETGRIARLRNSSKLIIEGDSYLYGNIDSDETSLVVNNTHNIQSRQSVISNNIVYNDVVIAHYQVFPKRTTLWYETIGNKIIKPLEIASNYAVTKYNGKLYSKGDCKFTMGDIDIKDKTIAIRVITPKAFSSSSRNYPITFNDGVNGSTIKYSQGQSTPLENISILYAPGEEIAGVMERGEHFVFLPSKDTEYLLHNIKIAGNESFLISDIYIIDKASKDIFGNERLRIRDILHSLDLGVQYDKYIVGYNKGTSSERPTYLTDADEGFEYYETTLHKPVYWTGDVTKGDKGWVDATGAQPNP